MFDDGRSLDVLFKEHELLSLVGAYGACLNNLLFLNNFIDIKRPNHL
jgi:hypothetical protein